MQQRVEMTCQELVEVITEYLERAMSDQHRERLERHLDDCPGCAAYLRQMRTVIYILSWLAVRDRRNARGGP